MEKYTLCRTNAEGMGKMSRLVQKNKTFYNRNVRLQLPYKNPIFKKE